MIVIADDDAGHRALLSHALREGGFDTVEAADGVETLELVAAHQVAAVVLDVNMPRLSGYEVCTRLAARGGTPVVLISGERVESYDRVAGLLMGADDYMVKPIAPDELVARVRAVLRRTNTAASPARDLTQREREILDLLADGLQGREIAHRLFISPKTVATHIQRILRKLNVHNRTQAVAVAARHPAFNGRRRVAAEFR